MTFNSFKTCILLSILLFMATISAPAQRRARPGSMRHTQAEMTEAQKKTTVKGRYICDGSRFKGQVLITGDAGGIKVGDAVITFSAGRYNFDFTSGELSMRTSYTKDERIKKGISDYAYENSWKKEKIGEDFYSKGKYAIIKQYDKVTLYLYSGDDTNTVFATIPLEDANASSFQFYEDNFLFDMKLAR